MAAAGRRGRSHVLLTFSAELTCTTHMCTCVIFLYVLCLPPGKIAGILPQCSPILVHFAQRQHHMVLMCVRTHVSLAYLLSPTLCQCGDHSLALGPTAGITILSSFIMCLLLCYVCPIDPWDSSYLPNGSGAAIEGPDSVLNH